MTAAWSVQWTCTIKMPDHELRLGSLAPEAGTTGGVLVVHEALLQEDLRSLRALLINQLHLDRPDKDPGQFRCAGDSSRRVVQQAPELLLSAAIKIGQSMWRRGTRAMTDSALELEHRALEPHACSSV